MPEPMHRLRRSRWPRWVSQPLQQFLAIEAVSGILLLAATVVALAWANSPGGSSYDTVWTATVGPSVGRIDLHLQLLHWVNDGLMAVFFFVVGLEIKREWVSGELRDRRAAALPAIAALGGMIAPALLFVAITAGAEGGHGWGIPMATDIAFAVGVLTLLRERAPASLKLFLLTLAIVDDIGAIAVIAIVYSGPLAWAWLAGAAVIVTGVLLCRRAGATAGLLYLTLGVALWLCVFQSGVHATVAGVAMGLLVPDRAGRFEAALHPWTGNLVVPLFALANAGIMLGGSAATGLSGGGPALVLVAVVVALVAGKTVGVSAFAWLAVRSGLGRLPEGVGWAEMVGVAALAGIGFTVSLFITNLAYATPALVRQAKLGVLLASTLAALTGSALLVRAQARRRAVSQSSRQRA